MNGCRVWSQSYISIFRWNMRCLRHPLRLKNALFNCLTNFPTTRRTGYHMILQNGIIWLRRISIKATEFLNAFYWSLSLCAILQVQSVFKPQSRSQNALRRSIESRWSSIRCHRFGSQSSESPHIFSSNSSPNAHSAFHP